MTSRFEGFDEEGRPVPSGSDKAQNSDTNTEVSEYESPLNSAESSPTKGANTIVSRSKITTPTRARALRSGNVKKLTEHFSSDSDTTEHHPSTVRKRRSVSTEHQQLPRGGERELRKKMAAQTRANADVEMWQVCISTMKTCLDEAQQSLDQNKPRSVLLGHAAEMTACEEAVDSAWENVMPHLEDTSIVIQNKELLTAKMKSRMRCSKTLACILAETEVPSAPIGAPIGFLRNPTSFGDLALPEFSGDFTVFQSFEGNWRGTISNGTFDDGAKKAYLLRSLKGEAKDFIGVDGLADKTY